MFKISTYFNPIRIIAGQREPVILNVIIKNESNESKLATVLVRLPFSLGFNRVGLERDARRRIGYVKEGSEKVVPIPVYGKFNIKQGTYPVNVKVVMHPDRYDKEEQSYKCGASLRVVGK